DAAAPSGSGGASARDAARAPPPDGRPGTGGGAPANDAADSDGTTDAPPAGGDAGEVVIDELLVNPAGTDTNREWIELANLTALPFDLRGLHVADSAKDVAV